MKNYRSVKSAYRDGYRVVKAKDYGDYSIFTLEIKNDKGNANNRIILQETNDNLEKFFGKSKLRQIMAEFDN